MKAAYYRLRGREYEKCTVQEFAQSFQEDRHVADFDNGTVRVSTVFLGLDHNFMDHGPPILFETLIFGGEYDGEMWRYSTYDHALVGHNAAVLLACPEFIHPALPTPK